MGSNIYSDEINNIPNIKEIYRKLGDLSQGINCDFDENDIVYLKRILFNNYLMLLLNIQEILEDTNNIQEKKIFLSFF